MILDPVYDPCPRVLTRFYFRDKNTWKTSKINFPLDVHSTETFHVTLQTIPLN